jgi:hypothetical protein
LVRSKQAIIGKENEEKSKEEEEIVLFPVLIELVEYNAIFAGRYTLNGLSAAVCDS